MENEVVTSAPPSRDWLTKLNVRFYRYRMLLKRRWWVLAITIGLGLAYKGWVIFSTPTQYESAGSLMVSPRVNISEANQVVEEQQLFYGTQLRLLRNQEIHERARRKLALEAANLSGTITFEATQEPHTSIFSIAATGSNPEYTQRYVDAVMEEFMIYKREKMGEVKGGAMLNISDELERLRKDLGKSEKELHEFVEANNMAFWDEQSKTASKFLNDLKTQQGALSTELRRLENLSSKQLLTSPGRPAPATPDGSSDSRTGGAMAGDLNAQYIQNSQELVQKRAELSERSRVWKPKHPRLIQMQDDVAKLERLLGTIETQNEELRLSRISSVRAELASLEESIKTWENKVLEASRKDAEYQRLQGAVTRTQGLYEKLLMGMQTLEIGAGASQESLQIMSKASPAVEVPKETIKHLLTGLIAGFICGAVLLILLDRADDRFSSSTEVIEHFSEPILGQIPNVSASRVADNLPLLQSDDDRYMFAESFRSLRSSLIFLPNQSELKTLIVTSAIPGEGKSTCTSNLGVTMALAGARVLLVDADLRRGDLASLFDVDGRVGLSSVLREEIPWQKATQVTKYPTLTLLPRGPVTNQSGELLLVPLLDTLLAEWKNAFDLVIFNTSPILATDDTATLAPNFDGTLMVVRAQFTSARLVRNSLNALYQRQVNVLGLILNCIDSEMPDYYYYRYPKYYAA
jgi:succinoglycan biosynthesis transport protein ExoP